MYPETIEVIKAQLSEDEPKLPEQLVEQTGLSRATIYNGLSILRAIRHHVGKNQYAYTLNEETEKEPIEEPGTIGELSWAEYTTRALNYVKKIHLKGNPTAESYAEGFQQIADSFQLIADHVKEVQERPDWRLVLGLDKEN